MPGYISEYLASGGKIDEPGKAIADLRNKRRQYEYETYYAPEIEKYAAGGLEASGNTLEREMAKLRMRLGYNQSAGAGTGGWWNLARSGMETAGMQKGQEIANQWEQFKLQNWLDYMNREDTQSFQKDMITRQTQAQLELMKQQAELNDPTWWNSFGSIVGMGLGIWGMQGTSGQYNPLLFNYVTSGRI